MWTMTMTNDEAGSAYQPGIDDDGLQLAPAIGCRQSEYFGGAGPALARMHDAEALLRRDRRPASFDVDDRSWFAVVTRSRHERKVYEQLQSRDVESFLPSVQRWSRWRDRRKLIDWPLFPGYCFVRCAWQDARSVLACKGVVQFVSFAARPAAVPDYEIDGIRRLLASQLPHDPCPFIEVGMWVEVVHGPLRGVRGRLVRKDRNTTLVVAIEMLGRALSVQIDAADVMAAAKPA
jgi:transcription antitermination factor NusG